MAREGRSHLLIHHQFTMPLFVHLLLNLLMYIQKLLTASNTQQNKWGTKSATRIQGRVQWVGLQKEEKAMDGRMELGGYIGPSPRNASSAEQGGVA